MVGSVLGFTPDERLLINGTVVAIFDTVSYVMERGKDSEVQLDWPAD